MDSMDLLNYGWRNYLSDIMGMDPADFQLAQGTLGLQTNDSSGLFLMADAVPPDSAVNFYDSTSMNKRSSAYIGLLTALLPETDPNSLSTALGDQYAAWIAWKLANPPKVGDAYLALFKRWAIQSSADPGALEAAEQCIEAAQNDPLSMAYGAFLDAKGRQSFVNSSGADFTLPIYSATNETATAAIANGGSIPKLDFDSGSISTPAESTPGLGPARSLVEPVSFFGGVRTGVKNLRSTAAERRLTQLNAEASTQRVTIVGKVGSYATLASSPGSWYSSDEVARALSGKGNGTIWDAGVASGGWNAFFDPNSGSLARYVSQLILISDYELTVTVHGQYKQSDLTLVKTFAVNGSWPLYSSAGPSSQKTRYQFNSGSSMSAVYQLDPGKIQIWGVTVRQVGSSSG